MQISNKAITYSASIVKVFAVFMLIVLATCSSQPDAESIIDKAIAVHGGKELENVNIEFQFRDKKYVVYREDGLFRYERIFQDSIGRIRDVLSNDGFIRILNGDTVALEEESKVKYANSVNSVVYFALLPFGLNDEAVNKEYLGQTQIEGKPYYEIKVTFDREAGGQDHEDTYVYWVNQQDYTMGFLAYAFQTDGGGTRFRKAINPRRIKGVRFLDYINYKYTGDSVDLDTYENLFETNKLEELSRIILKDIDVKLL